MDKIQASGLHAFKIHNPQIQRYQSGPNSHQNVHIFDEPDQVQSQEYPVKCVVHSLHSEIFCLVQSLVKFLEASHSLEFLELGDD